MGVHPPHQALDLLFAMNIITIIAVKIIALLITKIFFETPLHPTHKGEFYNICVFIWGGGGVAEFLGRLPTLPSVV